MKTNNEISKTIEITELYDFYKETLTDRQKTFFELYFNEDLTLQEIADEYKISRSAISDSINKTISLLNQMEKSLKMRENSIKLQGILTEFKENKIDKDSFIKKMEEEI